MVSEGAKLAEVVKPLVDLTLDRVFQKPVPMFFRQPRTPWKTFSRRIPLPRQVNARLWDSGFEDDDGRRRWRDLSDQYEEEAWAWPVPWRSREVMVRPQATSGFPWD